MTRRIAWLLVPLALAGCSRKHRPAAPLHLLERVTTAGSMAATGSVTTGDETRAALLKSASYQVTLPERALLTFGVGLSWAGEGEAPGWYHLSVRAGERVLAERTLNPRAARGWRDVSVPLKGPGEVTLQFEIRLTDRDGHPIPPVPGLLLAVSDPIVHDRDAYGHAPVIVLVSIDTVRRDHVSAYGYGEPTTPRIDRLATRGLLYEDAVSTSSWTLPAHLSMLTSVDPGVHGGLDMHHGFNHSVPTLAAVLKKAGYETQAVTSHLYVSPTYGLDDGFDFMNFYQDRKAKQVADAAIDLVDRFGDRPFFLFLHFYDPHWHYDPPEKELRIFEKEGSYRGKLTGLWQDFSKRTPKTVSPADLRHLIALYDGEIRYADDELGRILDHLTSLGMDPSTLVVVTSDHGEEFLDHGSWEHQKTLYEEVVRVPLVLAGPRVPHRDEQAQVSLLDVAPTILAWAGVAPPSTFTGRNLLVPVAHDRPAYGETDQTPDGSHKLFLRGGAGLWKMILTLPPKGGDTPSREEWYDLGKDPGEHHPKTPPADWAARLRRVALDRWHADREGHAAPPPINLTPEQRERLKALGYVTR